MSALITSAINAEAHTQEVDPARLESGQRLPPPPSGGCHRAQKTIGQGDIAASYSADRIGSDKPVRKPFSWQGSSWVCVSITRRNGAIAAEAYRLMHPQMFDGEPLTYAAKTADADAARADGCGFYHGMSVKHAGSAFVLCGPPVTFVPGETAQLSLF